MENKLQIFKNADFGEIRTVEVNGEPWFVAKDIAMILGYTNPRKAIIDHVDDDDKMNGVTIRDSIGRNQNPICINESGLYSLILSSKLPTAKTFKRWVTSEVLPAIRKTGSYSAKPVDNNRSKAMLNNSKARLAKLWLDISHNTKNQTYKEICNAYAANTLAEKEILALPVVTEKTYTATEVAEMLGVTAARIGKIANANDLKTAQYGSYYHDKSRYSNKEVETFRYNDEGVAALKKIMQLAGEQSA